MLKTALIGLGRIGWGSHLPEIAKHEQYSLCAVVDISEERLAEAKERYGAAGYQDYEEMLSKEKPDVVVIASPTVYHAEQAAACLRAGSNVILDKPMTINAEEARMLAETVAETGKKLTVYQPRRFNPVSLAAQKIIKSGKLGPIYRIHTSMNDYVRRNDWQAFRKNGGGMLSNYGAHAIDEALNYCKGEKVTKCFCQTRCIATLGDAEDTVKVFLVTESGVMIDIDIMQATAIGSDPLVIQGKYGAARQQKNAEGKFEMYVKYLVPEELAEKKVEVGLAANGRAYPNEGKIAWREEIWPLTDTFDYYSAAAAYMNGEGDAPVTLQESVTLMEVIDNCRAIADE